MTARRTWRGAPLHAVLAATALLTVACGGATKTGAGASTTSSTSSRSRSPSTTSRSGATSTASTSETTAPPAGPEWTTYDGNPERSGVDTTSPPVGTLSKAWSATVDGAVYAQPLIVGSQVIVATENDTVYSLSASAGQVQWSAHLGSPVSGGELPCGNITTSGITGTPVVDTASGTVWVVAFDATSTGVSHQLYGLDLQTGKVTSQRDADAAGISPTDMQQRGALDLAGGMVDIPYGGLYGDCGSYRGALVGLPTSGSGAGASFIVPTSAQGGIWAPPGAVVASDGSVWVSTGNGASRSTFDDSDAVVHLSATLTQQDVWAPSDWPQLNASDLDIGSTSPALVAGGQVLVVGKDSNAYLLNSSHLGGVGGQETTLSVCGGSGGYGGIAVMGASAFVPCRSSLVALAIGAGTLSVTWRVSVSGACSPVVSGGLVWCSERNGTLLGLDPGTGAVSQQLSLGGPTITDFPSLAAGAGRLFVPEGDEVVAVAGV